MTPSEEKGIVPGQLCKVVSTSRAGNLDYCTEGMIVEISNDDKTKIPWFKYIDGPKGIYTDTSPDRFCLNIDGLELIGKAIDKEPKVPDNHFLLYEYIRITYPKDEFLHILINNLKGNEHA